ncbi:pilus assembly FimT family protein [Roseateles sp. LYH14W]|uniref:Type II secretion system protein H n=1 Tax=Pelomonas parva TaxID=3299032 RepID=A0ABW7F761_9BURK
MLSGGSERGFSLVELMVAVSVLVILTALALPNFTSWIRNSRVRTVTETLQAGVRLAQAEAQRRAHTVVFFRTTDKDCTVTSTADANGLNWQIRSVPNALLTADTAEAIQCGVLTDVSAGVSLTSQVAVGAADPTPLAALCFGGDGRQTSMEDPTAIGANCTAGTARFDLAPTATGAENRALRLDVSLAGAIRLCDPGKASTAPDGCR